MTHITLNKSGINKFYNGDLGFEWEKHLRADKPTVKKDKYHNGEEITWVIDINDDSYFYYNKMERDIDFALAKKLLLPNN